MLSSYCSLDSSVDSAGAESSFVRDPIRRASWGSSRGSVLRRTLSVWGLGAALGLLSFPLRARSSEAELEPVSDGLELAGEADELCPCALWRARWKRGSWPARGLRFAGLS